MTLFTGAFSATRASTTPCAYMMTAHDALRDVRSEFSKSARRISGAMTLKASPSHSNESTQCTITISPSVAWAGGVCQTCFKPCVDDVPAHGLTGVEPRLVLVYRRQLRTLDRTIAIRYECLKSRMYHVFDRCIFGSILLVLVATASAHVPVCATTVTNDGHSGAMVSDYAFYSGEWIRT